MWDIWKVLILIYFIIGFLLWIVSSPTVGYQDPEKARLSRRRWRKAESIMIWVAIGYGILLLLFALGCVWYYFCGGVFVMTDIADFSFGGKILMSIVSLLLLGVVLSGIVIIFKK